MSDADKQIDEETLAKYERRAPGWQVRCLRCGFSQHWGKYGIRKGAVGRKYTICRCSRCKRICCHVIEKRKPRLSASNNPHMNDTEVAILIKDIREAFADVERGEGITLSQARTIDDYRPLDEQQKARELDTDKHWYEISNKKIERLCDTLAFLDAEGMRYYIAPFLIYALEYPESDCPAGDNLIVNLASDDRLSDFAIFNAAQSNVIARYLQFRAEDFEIDPVYAEEATKALQKYWGEFLTHTD